MTLRFTGLRLTELVTLCLDQVTLGTRSISIIGKGGKPRMIPIPPVLARVLGQYLDDIRPTLASSPFFFVNPRSHPANKFHAQFGPRPVYELVRRSGEGAGVPGRHFLTAGAIAMPRACCATARTSTSRNACSDTPISRRVGFYRRSY